jgi:hypothetical protein
MITKTANLPRVKTCPKRFSEPRMGTDEASVAKDEELTGALRFDE